MSFEGYYQALCANGHDCGADCYVFERSAPCSQCGAAIVWARLIDCTNGEDDAYPPSIPTTLRPKTYKTVKVAYTYEIPDPDLPSAA